jgi:hypothetical protein
MYVSLPSPATIFLPLLITNPFKARFQLELLLSPTEPSQNPATFHALTFNLSTIYELCTERSRALKIGLAEKVAEILTQERERGGGGGERVNGDFKL